MPNLLRFVKGGIRAGVERGASSSPEVLSDGGFRF
jgi:hypothetical protein